MSAFVCVEECPSIIAIRQPDDAHTANPASRYAIDGAIAVIIGAGDALNLDIHASAEYRAHAHT